MSALYFLDEDARHILERTYYKKKNSISERLEEGTIHGRQWTQHWFNGDGGVDHCAVVLLTSSRIPTRETKLAVLHDYVSKEYARYQQKYKADLINGEHYVWKDQWVHVPLHV